MPRCGSRHDAAPAVHSETLMRAAREQRRLPEQRMESMMITSGIAPLDDRLGGLIPGRLYLITGSPGTGKTTAALRFLGAGGDAGEKAVLLTSDDPADVIAQALYIGIDLPAHVASGQLVLLRFQADFTARFAHTPYPEMAFDELRALIGAARPSRVVVDSVAPFLEPGAGSSAGVAGLATFLDELGATAVVTHVADLAARRDRRLDPLVSRAAAIVHLFKDDGDSFRLEVRSGSTDLEAPFVTQPRADGAHYRLLDTHGFRNAVNAHMAADRAPCFTLLALQPRSGDARGLAGVVLRSLRFDGGDLAGAVEKGVAVYLHCAQHKDAIPFAERIRAEWHRAGHGKVDVAIAAYPAEDARVTALLAGAAAPPLPFPGVGFSR